MKTLLWKKILLTLLLVCIALFLTSCIPGDGKYTSGTPANFLSGLWHGFLVPFTLVLSIFDGDAGIYETANIGWWYDLGFYIGFVFNATTGIILGIRRAAISYCIKKSVSGDGSADDWNSWK